MAGLAGTRAASNYSNAQNLKINGNKFVDPKYYNDPQVAAILNRQSVVIEETNILQLYCGRYKWRVEGDNNLPVDYIEYMLFYNGLLAFFYTEEFSWLLLPCTVLAVNVYGEPEEVSVVLPTGIKPEYRLKRGDFILLRDNSALNVPFMTVQHYAIKIADTSRTLDVYARGMKKPIILSGSFKTKKTREVFMSTIQNNETSIIIDTKNFEDSATPVDILQNSTHNSEDLKGLHMYKQSLYNECVARLGITTPTVVKAAQINEDEINKNDIMSNIVLKNTFECRQKFTEQIYAESGIKLTCELSSALEEQEQDGDKNGE